MLKQIIILSVFSIIIFSCSKKACEYDDEYSPDNIDAAINYFNCTWGDETKQTFVKIKESEIISEENFFYDAQQIKNEWKLGIENNNINEYFKEHGVDHPDDMVLILLTSYHRKLNNKDIGLDIQINDIVNYWEKIHNFQKQSEEQNVVRYKSLNIGDKVSIFFLLTVDAIFGEKVTAIPQGLIKEYINSNKVLCGMEGAIVSRNDGQFHNFKIRIEKLCTDKKIQLGVNNFIQRGDTINYHVSGNFNIIN